MDVSKCPELKQRVVSEEVGGLDARVMDVGNVEQIEDYNVLANCSC